MQSCITDEFLGHELFPIVVVFDSKVREKVFTFAHLVIRSFVTHHVKLCSIAKQRIVSVKVRVLIGPILLFHSYPKVRGSILSINEQAWIVLRTCHLQVALQYGLTILVRSG